MSRRGPGGGQALRAAAVTRSFCPQASGNKVSRQSVLCGSQNIVLNGKVGGGEGAAVSPRCLVPPSSSAGWEGSATRPRGPCHHL